MTERPAAAEPRPWTCPFCPLLCDSFGVRADPDARRLVLTGSNCPRAMQALGGFGEVQAAGKTGLPTLGAPLSPSINGQPCTLEQAVGAAAQALHAARQPLLAGLGCDVAGARALYRLAQETGAICDAAGGPALMHGLRALQDRGAFTTTLAEVRTRADLIVCVGSAPQQRLPEFFRRCGLLDADPNPRLNAEVKERQLVFLGAEEALAAVPELPGVRVRSLGCHGNLFNTVHLLAAGVAGAAVALPAELATLVQQLRAARYAVLVWEGATLPAQGALIVEAIQRIVVTLNRSTRAAALPLGGGEGAATANQVFAWLSGLPMRSRAGPLGLEHEPLRFDTATLLAQGAVDLLLWVSAFGTAPPPSHGPLPQVVLGRTTPQPVAGARSIFIPVSTPGIGSAGHLFRTDGVVLMPLHAVCDDGLPTVAAVAQRLHQALMVLRGQPVPQEAA